MLSSEHRFHGLNSLSFVHRQGKTVRGGQLALKYVLNNRRSAFRCAVVVSKKVNKSAVVRNRIRRRVFEVMRQQSSQISEPYDLVLTIFEDQVADTPPAELEKQLVELLERARVVNKQ